MTSIPNTPVTGIPSSDHSLIRASQYSYDQLAEIYNQARVDYIVPMPMNGKRMKEYIDFYDIDLHSSFVSLNNDGLETGIAMLGVRGDRTWVTRLGVIPERRGHRVGQHLAEALLEESARMRAKLIQLEVIVGNAPAYHLFTKLGFEPIRELLVVGRPPGAIAVPSNTADMQIRKIASDEFETLLNTRAITSSWLDETASLMNAGDLHGVLVEAPNEEPAWVIFRSGAFQLSHFAFSTTPFVDGVRAALGAIYQEFNRQDTKLENLPGDSPIWPVLQSTGFIESFRRTEMYLRF